MRSSCSSVPASHPRSTFLPAGRHGNDPVEARLAGFRLACRGNPVERLVPVGGRQALEKLPGSGLCPEQPQLGGVQFCAGALLVGVDRGTIRRAPLEGREPRGLHTPQPPEHRDAPDIDRAPDTSRPARREADGVTLLAEAAAHAVYPPETQRLVHRLRPVDAGFARALLAEPDQQLLRARVITGQPGAEILRAREVSRLHAGQVSLNEKRSPASSASGALKASPKVNASGDGPRSRSRLSRA